MVRILVVEDDEKLNHVVCRYLGNSGFETVGWLDAKSAYNEMYNGFFDLIISDIMMPEVDGFEFAENIRKVNKYIPILFMQRGFMLGIDDYMVKPIEFEEMLLRVRSLLRQANIETGRKVTVGNLTLDADAMSTMVNDEEIPVTTREFNILYKLPIRP